MKLKKIWFILIISMLLIGGSILLIKTNSRANSNLDKRHGAVLLEEIHHNVAEEEAYLRTGQLLLDEGKYKEAVLELMKLKSVGGPSWRVARVKISLAYEALGDYKSALHYLEEHHKNAPHWAIERHASRLSELRQRVSELIPDQVQIIEKGTGQNNIDSSGGYIPDAVREGRVGGEE